MRFQREGICRCGDDAVVDCRRCGRPLCDAHARALPPPPEGISDYALGQFGVAVRLVEGPHCESCRAEQGHLAVALTDGAPRAPLPEHWLDRAIALCGDRTRSAEEKAAEARLPASLTPAAVVEEFLRRIGAEPPARVLLPGGGVLRRPAYAEGWKVECRRTEYTQWWPETWFEDPQRSGRSARFRLPVLIALDGRILGPVLDDDQRQSPTWYPIPDSDIDLERLVTGVARIFVLRDMGY